MLLKLLILLPLLLRVTAKRSFTLVIDTTYSMKREIQIMKYVIGPVLREISNSSTVDNYVIVPFNDPDVGPAQILSSPEKMVESINALRISGGEDYPEKSLSGLEMALQQSKPQSNIFLFTNACAKDEAKFRDIEELCRTTQSRVVIFMSGVCDSAIQFGRMGVYYDVTKVCSGNVFIIDLAHLPEAFNFMREIAKNDYEDLAPWEPFTGSRELVFNIDRLTRDAIVVVNGDQPTLRLRHESGQSPITERLINTARSVVYRIIEPRPGTYHSYVDSRAGETTVTVYKKTEFPFLIGFSPRYTISIQATSSRPLPNIENYILIVVPNTYGFRLKTLILHDIQADKQRSLNLIDIRLDSSTYTTSAFFEDQKHFQLTVSGLETRTNENFRIKGNIIETQSADTNSPWVAATVEIIPPDSPLTNYDQKATAACKVIGSPKPTIWWEDETGQQMTAESDILEYPATHISYVDVPNLRANKTLSCKAMTPNGEDAKSIELFVYRPYVFEMIQTPQDSTFEYESQGKLYCQVQAYPEAQINWYHNNSRLFTTDFNNEINVGDNQEDKEELKSTLDYTLEDNALVINKMSSRLTGEYKCEVVNEVKTESYTAIISISGLEPPEVEVDSTDVTSKLGDDVEISCRITRGRPTPVVTWWYKSVDSYDFDVIPEDVIVEGSTLKISDGKSVHKGVYKCQAVNDQGQDSREITLKVHYAPVIEGEPTNSRQAFEEDKVELKCYVDADPRAAVKWEKKEDDILVPLTDRHVVDANNTLSFFAFHNDSGAYVCSAENEAGTAEKTVALEVLVRPYIITPVTEPVRARVGGSVVLPCTVHASPAVTIIWRFTAFDSPYRTKELFRENGLLSKDLNLQNLTKAQAGTYLCLVENSVGVDRINIILYVE